MQSMSRSMSQSNDSNLRMSRRRHSRSCSNSPYSRDRTVSRRHSRSASNSWSGIQTHGTTSVGNMDIKPEPTSVPNVEIKSEPEEQSEISEQSNVRTDGDVWSTGWDCDALSSVQDRDPKGPNQRSFLTFSCLMQNAHINLNYYLFKMLEKKLMMSTHQALVMN